MLNFKNLLALLTLALLLIPLSIFISTGECHAKEVYVMAPFTDVVFDKQTVDLMIRVDAETNKDMRSLLHKSLVDNGKIVVTQGAACYLFIPSKVVYKGWRKGILPKAPNDPVYIREKDFKLVTFED